MIKKSTPPKNDQGEASLGEKIFLGPQSGVTKVPSDAKDEELTNKQTDKLQSSKEEPIANHRYQDILSYIHKTASLLEMWNVIEGAGISREVVNKIFTTDEAVAELYQVVAKRIHYEREQEMIRRLRGYTSKE